MKFIVVPDAQSSDMTCLSFDRRCTTRYSFGSALYARMEPISVLRVRAPFVHATCARTSFRRWIHVLILLCNQDMPIHVDIPIWTYYGTAVEPLPMMAYPCNLLKIIVLHTKGKVLHMVQHSGPIHSCHASGRSLSFLFSNCSLPRSVHRPPPSFKLTLCLSWTYAILHVIYSAPTLSIKTRRC
jgi:hypothetical protein